MRRERAVLANDRLLATDAGQLVCRRLMAAADEQPRCRCRFGLLASLRSGVALVGAPAARWAGWLAGVVGEAGLQARERPLGLRAGVGGELRTSPTAEHRRPDVRDERPLDAHERLGGHPRLDIVPGRPHLLASARPGRPRSGSRPPAGPWSARPAPIRRCRPCEDLRDRLVAKRPERSSRCGVDEGVAVQVHGLNLRGWIARCRRWPGLPMRWSSPRTATGNCDRSDATLSPSAKLLVSRYLHRYAEIGRGCCLPVVVTRAGGITAQTRWSSLLCPSWSQAGPVTHGQGHDQRK